MMTPCEIAIEYSMDPIGTIVFCLVIPVLIFGVMLGWTIHLWHKEDPIHVILDFGVLAAGFLALVCVIDFVRAVW